MSCVCVCSGDDAIMLTLKPNQAGPSQHTIPPSAALRSNLVLTDGAGLVQTQADPGWSFTQHRTWTLAFRRSLQPSLNLLALHLCRLSLSLSLICPFDEVQLCEKNSKAKKILLFFSNFLFTTEVLFCKKRKKGKRKKKEQKQKVLWRNPTICTTID